ncbi:hypothetical protein [Flavobacterium aestuarii]|uniref:hypothetical protein n=1 Tax=Flavobacterium aestuarii TaxID=3149227 RepID=UPI0032B55627
MKTVFKSKLIMVVIVLMLSFACKTNTSGDYNSNDENGVTDSTAVNSGMNSSGTQSGTSQDTISGTNTNPGTNNSNSGSTQQNGTTIDTTATPKK